MTKQRKPPKRRAYLNEFHQTLDGGYVYTGAHWNADPTKRLALLRRLWPAALLLSVAAVVPGCLPAPWMMNTAYVVLPYALDVVASGYFVWRLIRLTSGGNPMRDYTYQKTVPGFRASALFPLGCSALAAVGLAVYLLLHGPSNAWPQALLSLICYGSQILLSLFLRSTDPLPVWTRDEPAG